MVTTTHQFDEDMPSHDALGTDLRRVAAMLAAGYAERQMAQALGTTTQHVRYAVAVLTNDREGAPSPEEIEAVCREIQTGWTSEMWVAARRRENRFSSSVVRPDPTIAASRRREGYDRMTRRRVYEEPVPVHHRTGMEFPWEARVHVGDRGARQVFATREEAQAWGRAWLVREYERQQDDSCCGV